MLPGWSLGWRDTSDELKWTREVVTGGTIPASFVVKERMNNQSSEAVSEESSGNLWGGGAEGKYFWHPSIDLFELLSRTCLFHLVNSLI